MHGRMILTTLCKQFNWFITRTKYDTFHPRRSISWDCSCKLSVYLCISCKTFVLWTHYINKITYIYFFLVTALLPPRIVNRSRAIRNKYPSYWNILKWRYGKYSGGFTLQPPVSYTGCSPGKYCKENDRVSGVIELWELSFWRSLCICGLLNFINIQNYRSFYW